MNPERAQQIINSDKTINVLFNGTPVWIESLDPEGNRATVKTLDEKRKLLEVPVAALVEASPSL
ncbi:MAG: H-type small acid-soluble spore protein [Bacillota bacterium]